jgi:hypothetical protein
MFMIWLVACGGGGAPHNDASVCEAWGIRKHECGVEMRSHLPPASERIRVEQPYNLYDQCRVFPQRNAAVAACNGVESCSAFAECTMTLTFDGFDPRTAPDMCDAFAGRGGAPWLVQACREAGKGRDKVADCMMAIEVSDPRCAGLFER